MLVSETATTVQLYEAYGVRSVMLQDISLLTLGARLVGLHVLSVVFMLGVVPLQVTLYCVPLDRHGSSQERYAQFQPMSVTAKLQ